MSTNTLEKPELPGWNGRFSRSRICTTTAATPRSRAIRLAACQTFFAPALIRTRPTYWITALATTRDQDRHPVPHRGCVVAGPVPPPGRVDRAEVEVGEREGPVQEGQRAHGEPGAGPRRVEGRLMVDAGLQPPGPARTLRSLLRHGLGLHSGASGRVRRAYHADGRVQVGDRRRVRVAVAVRVVVEARDPLEVPGRRRRGDLPFQPAGAPRVLLGGLTLEDQRPHDVDHEQEDRGAQEERRDRGEPVQELQRRVVGRDPARHPQRAHREQAAGTCR